MLKPSEIRFMLDTIDNEEMRPSARLKILRTYVLSQRPNQNESGKE